jgi:hypothetical protein
MEKLSSVLAGFQLAIVSEVEAYWLENPKSKRPVTPEQPPQPIKPKRTQVGSISERIANPGRANPCTCYYFCWNEKDDDGRWQKRKIYIPQNQMNEVCMMVNAKQPYWETLKAIRKSGKLHHTNTPKI